jgi:hypothetical protein
LLTNRRHEKPSASVHQARRPANARGPRRLANTPSGRATHGARRSSRRPAKSCATATGRAPVRGRVRCRRRWTIEPSTRSSATAVAIQDRGRLGLQALQQTLRAVSARIVGGEPTVRGPQFDRDVLALLERVIAEARLPDRPPQAESF